MVYTVSYVQRLGTERKFVTLTFERRNGVDTLIGRVETTVKTFSGGFGMGDTLLIKKPA